MIDYTELTHNGQPRKKITRAAFELECIERSGGTLELLREYHDIVPCDCGEIDCPGWQAKYLLKNKRR